VPRLRLSSMHRAAQNSRRWWQEAMRRFVLEPWLQSQDGVHSQKPWLASRVVALRTRP
jgi:hypothetical protein